MGTPQTKKHIEWLRVNHQGSGNPNWKGNSISYHGLHQRIRKEFLPPENCQKCNQVKPLDLANISGNYLFEHTDWEYLCRSCHMKSDERYKNLIHAKLTVNEVVNIYLTKDKTPEELSKIYNVKPNQIKRIWSGQRWSSITKELEK